jgi:large conductance mechanosensitive channel
MRADLRSFLERATVVELLLAFAFATTTVSFVSAVVNGLVLQPIRYSGHDFPSSLDHLSAAILGRAFDFSNILASGLVLALVVAGAAWLLRAADDALWDETVMRVCPHCLSEIPRAAPVCSYCTRDVPSPSDDG